MNDTMLFVSGLSAFGLMVIGIVFTVVEFRAISERERRRRDGKVNSSPADE